MQDQSPLRAYRKSQGLTLRALATQLDISEGQLSRIETAGTTSLERALKLASVTKLPVEAFLRGAAA